MEYEWHSENVRIPKSHFSLNKIHSQIFHTLAGHQTLLKRSHKNRQVQVLSSLLYLHYSFMGAIALTRWFRSEYFWSNFVNITQKWLSLNLCSILSRVNKSYAQIFWLSNRVWNHAWRLKRTKALLSMVTERSMPGESNLKWNIKIIKMFALVKHF